MFNQNSNHINLNICKQSIHIQCQRNPLSDAMWWYRTISTLSQGVACCMTSPSHYLSQCWIVIGEVLWHSSQIKFTDNARNITLPYWTAKHLLLFFVCILYMLRHSDGMAHALKVWKCLSYVPLRDHWDSPVVTYVCISTSLLVTRPRLRTWQDKDAQI